VRAWLALALLLVSANAASATVVATELTTATAINAKTLTTSSVSPTSGAMLVLVAMMRQTGGCAGNTTPTVSGLSSTWTGRDTQVIVSPVYTMTLFTSVSNGTSGTVTWSTTGAGTCENIALQLIQFTGINTSTTDGYDKSAHSNLTGCSPCTPAVSFSGYDNVADTMIIGCGSGFASTSSTVTFSGNTGSWANGTNIITAAGPNERLVLNTGWLITKDGFTAGGGTCTITVAGAANSMIFIAEITAGPNVGPKHKVTTL
jgi:hypothetical protein